MGSRYRPSRGVKQLSPGLWKVRARATDPRTGRAVERERRVKCKTWQEAAEERDRLAKEIMSGATSVDERMLLDDYVVSWLRRRASRVRPSTAARYADVTAHLVAWLGGYYLDALRASDIEDWIARGLKQGYRHATLNGWLRIARLVSKDSARDHGCRDWAAGVAALPEGRTKGPRGRALAPHEFLVLLEALEACAGGVAPDVARALLTLAWTGMRRGEVLALRWSDYADGELCVERSVWRGIEGSTKTDDPRIVVVVEPLARILESQRTWLEHGYRRRQKDEPGVHPGRWSGLIFPASPRQARNGASRRDGELRWYRSGTALANGLSRVVKAAGLPRITLHSLRRTWTQLARRAGVEAHVRRAIGGWRSEAAQAIYEAVDHETRAAAGAALVALIEGRKQ